MKSVFVKYRDGFKIEEGTKLYPILSNIEDKVGVLVEHRILNGNNKYLRYAIQKIKGKYYFFDVRNTVIQKSREEDFSTFICPYCREKMFVVNSFERNKTIIPIHLKHYKKTNKECIFRTDDKSLQLKERYYKSEEFVHREILEIVCKKANEGMILNLPNSYKLFRNTLTNEVRAEINNKEIKVIKALECKDVSDNKLKKYTPDIIFYTDDNREIYCEITAFKSKDTSNYFDIWNELGNTVIEIKRTEITDNIYDKYMFDRNLLTTYLYDPILDKARKSKIYESQKIAEYSKYDSKQVNKHKNENKKNIKNIKDLNKRNNCNDYNINKAKMSRDVDKLIDLYINDLLKNNILMKSKKKKKSKKREHQLCTVKENRTVKYMNFRICKDGICILKSIPIITARYLRDDGYSVIKSEINFK